MRIVQIIDSLETGGAERMAINYANVLSHRVGFSGLVATRKEGSLLSQLDGAVDYFFLKKTHTLDFLAIYRLTAYCVKNKIDVLHAHGNSWFTAVLVKMTVPRLKIIWHDHYGLSEFLDSRNTMGLKWASHMFSGIVSVNTKLKEWALRQLHCKKVVYLPNFADLGKEENRETMLAGLSGKRIVCLANLREQKDHFLLLKVASLVNEKYPDWSFHLVGKDFNDSYSQMLRDNVAAGKLSGTVFFYGSKKDIPHILDQADICILTSKSEGLPVALLEYGESAKPVVVTAVGEIPQIVRHNVNGLLVSSGAADLFCAALIALIEDVTLRIRLGNALQQEINSAFSREAIIDNYTHWIKEL